MDSQKNIPTELQIYSTATSGAREQETSPFTLQNVDPKKFVKIENVDEEKAIDQSTTATIGSTSASGNSSTDEVELLSEGWSNPGWLTVISLLLINFCVFGVVFSWGIIQNVYLTEVYVGRTDGFSIEFVGTLSATVIVCSGILVTPLTQIIGNRNTMLIGSVLGPMGLICASFANELWQIYLSEGLLFGIGGALAWHACVSLPAQWFNKNRALATGLGISGTGLGGLALSPITQTLVEHTGYRMTLRYLGIICFVIMIAACALARTRWPRAGLKSVIIIDRSLLTTDFIIFMAFGFMVIISYVTPFYLLPQYGATIGVDSSQVSVVIGVMSACNAISRILLGFLADRFGRINAMFLVTFLAGFFMMVVWIEVKSLATLYVFGVLYGLTGGGFISLFPAVTAEFVPVQKLQQGVSLAFFSMLLGGVFGTPISGLLRDRVGFMAAIEFSGATTMASAFILLYLRQRRSHGKIFCKV